MQASLQFLGAGTPDGGSKTILLTIEGHRYLFNCSPGTQRCSLNHGVKFTRVEAVFFTDLTWKSMGGFKGMVSTLSDLEAPIKDQIKVIGPVGLKAIVEASYPFLKRSISFIDVIEIHEGYEFRDSFLTVTPIYGSSGLEGYLTQGPRVPGIFDAVKARSLGLKPGPSYRLLLEGKEVPLPDGSVVKPDDVVSPSLQFPTISITERPCQLGDISICYQVPAFPSMSWHPIFTEPIICESALAQACSQFHSQLFYEMSNESIQPLDEWILLPRRELKRQRSDLPECLTTSILPADSPVVVTLGTGAAMPGKYRNVSSTYVNIDGFRCIFDCGEATLGQLMRKFGPAYTDVVANLNLIAISHLHSDHHLGLLSFLEECTFRELIVVLPAVILDFILVFGKQNGHDFAGIKFVILEDSPEVIDLITGHRLQKVVVDHCENAFGFLLWKGSEKLALFSGDTRPADAIIEAAKNVRVLIHEATMPDSLLEEAIVRKHCTISEAADVCYQAQPTIAVLTHFSQRFGKELPTLKDGVIMASDFMHVTTVQPLSDDPMRHEILRA